MKKIVAVLLCVFCFAMIGVAQCAGDVTPPTITCPPNWPPIIGYAEANSCQAWVEIPLPSYSDDCGVMTVINDYNGTENASDFYPAGGVAWVTWTVTDTTGNVSNCTISVTVVDDVNPSMTCSQNITVNVDAGSCFATITDLGTPVITDNCGVATVTNNHPSQTYTLGQSAVTWTVTDLSGNTTTCAQSVNVIDNIVPTITCPPTQTLVLNNSCIAIVPDYISLAAVSDNCTFMNTVTQNPAQGTVISENTTVTIIATDDSGNTTLCQFEVITQPSSEEAIAQEDFETCTPSNAITANEPPNGYIGLWTFVQGSGSFEDATIASTNVTLDSPGIIVLQWTINDTDEGCGVPSSSVEVMIMYYEASCEGADAGPDMELCYASSAELQADEVVLPAVGEWYQAAGSSIVAFSDVNDPYATVSNLIQGPYQLYWTIPASECCPETFDEVIINIYPLSEEVADAGPDQELCSTMPITFLQGNTPAYPASGMWTMIEGSAVFADIYDPNTEVVFSGPGAYWLVWHVDNGPCGNPSEDEVYITVFDETQSDANAGEDIEICWPESMAFFDANEPILPAYGVWVGPGTYWAVNNPNSGVAGLGPGIHVITWTIYNGPCGITSDQLTVTVLEVCPPIAGDLDGDGEISMEEFNEIIGAFGCISDDCAQYDLDGDGIVGMSDLLILIANMGD